MDDWQKAAMEMAVELSLCGEIRVEADGEEYVFNGADLIALGIMVFVGGPARTAEVVCSWLDRARVSPARPMGDA